MSESTVFQFEQSEGLKLAVTLKEHEMEIKAVRKEVSDINHEVRELKTLFVESQKTNNSILKELTNDLQSRRAIKDFIFKLPTIAVIIVCIVYASLTIKPGKFNTASAAAIVREEQIIEVPLLPEVPSDGNGD